MLQKQQSESEVICIRQQPFQSGLYQFKKGENIFWGVMLSGCTPYIPHPRTFLPLENKLETRVTKRIGGTKWLLFVSDKLSPQ